jgi:hypothetical protein
MDGTTGYAGTFAAAAPGCPSCSCGKATGESCALQDRANATAYSDGACTLNSRTVFGAQLSPDCFVLPLGSESGVRPPAVEPVRGTCMPASTGAVEIEPWTFTERVAVCPTVDTGGCAGTDVCVALPEAPYSSRLCVD